MKICPKCQIEHEKFGQFCSRSCANSRIQTEDVREKKSKAAKRYYKYNGTQRNYSQEGVRQYWKDVKAGKVVRKKAIRITLAADPIQLAVQQVLSGQYRVFRKSVICTKIRRYLLYTNGNRCQICNNTEWQNKPIPLVCDHIDGDHSNIEISNFRLVCCNCDAQLPTYKSKNIGKGNPVHREYKQKRAARE